MVRPTWTWMPPSTPIDSQDGAGLIKLADAAMYSGKQSGKFCVRRNTGDLALSSA